MEPDARGRLQLAAMEFYVERGFEQTTIGDIAEHTGLTERTFFRHFADKREVLFSGRDEFLYSFVATVASAPDETSPLEAVAAALRERGVTEPAASLAAQSGIAVFQVGFAQWIDAGNTREFSQIITEALAALKLVAAGR